MNSNNSESILIGLIGSGIQKSLTPAMHEHEGDEQRIRYLYRKIDLDVLQLGVADLPDLLLAAERMGYTGLNITHPCKQAVVELLDELSESAAKIGAVNTVVFRDGKRIGHNTDAWGFLRSFKEEIAGDCRHDRIILMGAGGAGTAIAHALLINTKTVLEVFDVDDSSATALVDRLAELYGKDRAVRCTALADSIPAADGIVNATPVGMTSHPGCPLDVKLLTPDLWVADIIYFPMETELVKAATAAGCRVMRGGTMAVYQAVRAFERFSGIDPDAARMKAHFRSLVGQGNVTAKATKEAAVAE